MKIQYFRSLVLFMLATLILVPLRNAQAHGEPVIAVQPSIAPAGGQITITGTEMESGEVFVIGLESTTNTIPLGEATATGEGEEAGFVAMFTIPADVAPGSYTVRAETEEGEATTADLTVTESSSQASSAPAMVQEPTGDSHMLDRTKPKIYIAGVVFLALISLVFGLLLVRKPG
ncbi:MAG TPA: hypothetical protein VJ436_00740 [Anaerolineales bacterium]|nr:hypothetical protein [Anaerolineales bacterium]